MKTTVEFLDAVRVKRGLTSDNQLAIFLGCTRQAISGYRYKRTFLDDEIAMRVADTLDIDPAFVLACVHAERERNLEVRAVWERIANLSMGVAAALMVVWVLPIVGVSNELAGWVVLCGTSPAAGSSSLCIMSNYYLWIAGLSSPCSPLCSF